MSRFRAGMGAVFVLVLVLSAVVLMQRPDTGGDGVIVWKRGTPADLELAGRPQLVDFFHPL